MGAASSFPTTLLSSLVFVTGATGLVGSELTRQLVASEHRVRILRRHHSHLDLLGDTQQHVEHCFGDVTDPVSLADAMEGVTEVYHVAAALGEGQRGERDMLMQVNVQGTAHVVNAALQAGVRRLVHTSSMAAFGRPPNAEQVVLDETATWSPSKLNSVYAESKYLAELEVHRGIAEGLDAVIVNPALIFGAGRPNENTVQIVQRIRDGKLPVMPAGGTNVVDARDVAAGHLRAMQHGQTGRRYFLGSENLSWVAICQTIARALGVSPPRRVLSPGLALAAGAVSEWTAMLTRRAPLITRERARTMSAFYQYSNARAVEELGCTFRPFAETAAYLASLYR